MLVFVDFVDFSQFECFRLDLYIYNHMKEINLQDVAEIFAKEANIETSQCKWFNGKDMFNCSFH